MGGENGSDRERGRKRELGSEGLGEVWRGIEQREPEERERERVKDIETGETRERG